MQTTNDLLDMAKRRQAVMLNVPQISDYKLAKLLGVNPSNMGNWRAGRSTLSAEFVPRLALLAGIDARWSGWSLRHGALHHPDGWTFSPAELTALPLHLQELMALRRELSGLRQQVQTLLQQALKLENQPPALCRAS